MINSKNNHSYISYSLQGVGKKQNEDNYLAVETSRYYAFAIFDGVGSARNSRVATNLAKEFIESRLDSYMTDDIQLDRLMFDCNNFILGKDNYEAYTTYCIVLIFKEKSDTVIYSHLGDSRLYLISNQYIDQITNDDKQLSGNILTKCLGMSDLQHYDFTQKCLNITHENLLLCTDGFYSFLEKDRLQFFDILNKKSLKSIKEGLVHMVRNQNKDDATFVLVK